MNVAVGRSGVEKYLGFLFVYLFGLFIWKRVEPPIKGQGSLLCLSRKELKSHKAGVDTRKDEDRPDFHPELQIGTSR